MRNIWFLMIIACLAFGLACAKPAAPPVRIETAAAADTHPADDAPRISLADAKKEFDSGTAVFIDTRGSESYRQEHIKGAINITAADLAAKADTLPKGKKIIAYCS
ncbi:MAG TPA: rhodanese-like domain-containing protein [Pyrinomonadaceae bacterium]|nr:rhodanese-like domain-containing protein [Pyrinomonadaceae bacterium]